MPSSTHRRNPFASLSPSLLSHPLASRRLQYGHRLASCTHRTSVTQGKYLQNDRLLRHGGATTSSESGMSSEGGGEI
ncbi:hypothetical protein K466DRAFT_373713 [Polyporus arcularius HHB13444]|uniref:Uncharacterized protein n=1 Tax=Polyporus arcularius HHB13444 TaxID=1314778 RepID=A0A5C3NSR1_9APHY|nr:hypothetical protein K466DRAFT_373713 [Polyporus arcularius HHB13444]